MIQVLLWHACAQGHSIRIYSSRRKSFLLTMVADWKVCRHRKYRWTCLQPVLEGTLLGSQIGSFLRQDHIFVFYSEAIFLLYFCAWHLRNWGFDLWWVNLKNQVEAFWNSSLWGGSIEGEGKEARQKGFQDSFFLLVTLVQTASIWNVLRLIS